ncbi:MAG: class I SAM-dependent methyltransferase [Candidatus Thiodiazotropha sp. LLP2]
MKLLIFPVDMDASEAFISVTRSLGIPLIGATSVEKTTHHQGIDQLVHLPYITESGFDKTFADTLKAHDITHIYTPHPGVWTYLKQLNVKNIAHYSYQLCHPSPYQNNWLEYKASYDWAERISVDNFLDGFDTRPGAGPHRQLTISEYAGLHKQFIRIAGQCDVNKLTALTQILRLTPKGDLVEIGSLYGRSAFVIAWLSDRYRIGSFISIDPWSNDALESQGESATILHTDPETIDFEPIFKSYLSNMSLLNNVGYIRETSDRGVDKYRRAVDQGKLYSPEFSEITVSGSIALLHIDGNHGYAHVRQDIELWEPYLASGGWLLLDDYLWAFGSGPQQAGDELIGRGNFDLAFVASDTLFLRKI